MKNFIELLKKYKVYILSALLLIFFFRSCTQTGKVRKLEKEKIATTEVLDSLNSVISGQKDTINNISEVIRLEKIKVHSEYDNYISNKDRGDQLMELHMVVKENIKKLQK